VTLALERLKAFAGWLDQSSASFPCSAKPPRRNFFGQPIAQTVEMVVVGRVAEILPWDFTTSPTTDFDPQALPLFVSHEDAEALNLAPVADLSPPSGQGRAADRLHMIVGKMEDATLIRSSDAPWRADEGWWGRMCIILPLERPDVPIADQIAAFDLSGIDLDNFVILCVPVWHLTAKERASLRLPFIPS
jgi:hypothetical protein